MTRMYLKKYNGEAALPAAHRVHIARKSIDNSNWLMVDPGKVAIFTQMLISPMFYAT